MGHHRRADNVNATIVAPKPQVLRTYNNFEGLDGKWSTFYLNAGARNESGDGGQNFRAHISTSSGLTFLPLEVDWCRATTCSERRGLELLENKPPPGFEYKQVAEFNEHGSFGLPSLYGWQGSQFGEDNNPAGIYGYSTVGLGLGGRDTLKLKDRLVVATPSKDYFMSVFGLGARTVTVLGRTTQSFLSVFAQDGFIPSLSYGYTAGAYYRKNGRGVHGSLVLGGYDTARFKAGTETPISLPDNYTLIVNVMSVAYNPGPSVPAREVRFTGGNTLRFYASIDSAFPYLVLPSDLCDKFAETFRLSYDEKFNLYYTNDTVHKDNQNENGTVSFLLNAEPNSASTKTTRIDLPYAAFDHNMDNSLIANRNTTRYFPIKKSKTGMFVLGRTFLQEAYITVDYENKTFSVAPALFPDTTSSSTIAAILSPKYRSNPSSSSPSSTPGSESTGLSGGAIAGIVIGILVALGFLGLGAFFHWKKRRAHHYKDKADSESDAIQPSDLVKYGRSLDPGAELPGSPTPDYYGRETKDGLPFPRLPELESPPVEMYSPPLETATPATGATGEGADYFKIRRRRATRESSGNNTPGTPGIPELAGDDGKFTVDGQHFEPVQSPLQSPVISPIMSPIQSPTPSHHRGPSDTSLQTNIDEVMAQGAPPKSRSQSPSPQRPSASATSAEAQVEGQRPRDASPGISPDATLERRPSHTRGLSEITVRSDSTGVSNPSPEEVEIWNKNKNEPMRPLSE